ncbi:expressed unknown protein [Seminavis robusta]|uniref:Uncharacterized protein n=1 Tax=Seminavis robusta TaxID=568900 RepID=A0A9N8HH38_9STRA|nr:expressed unknown protein [Seminavis robusta]|eukprot:Sro541_g163130.1 n/a (265) ;mRNA; f:13368-14353
MMDFLDELTKLISPSQLEASIPASLAVAAAICWLDPSKTGAVFFGLMALGFVFRRPLLELMTRPISQHITEAATKSWEDLARDPDRFDRLLTASTDALKRAIGSEPLRATLKGAIVESMNDQELEGAMLDTINNAIVKSAQDEQLLTALKSVSKQSLLETLRDKEFMTQTVSSLVEAMLEASKDEGLKKALMEIATDSVSTALQDEKFVSMVRKVLKDTLKDKDLYRASAAGVVGAFMPKTLSKTISKRLNQDDNKNDDQCLSS